MEPITPITDLIDVQELFEQRVIEQDMKENPDHLDHTPQPLTPDRLEPLNPSPFDNMDEQDIAEQRIILQSLFDDRERALGKRARDDSNEQQGPCKALRATLDASPQRSQSSVLVAQMTPVSEASLEAIDTSVTQMSAHDMPSALNLYNNNNIVPQPVHDDNNYTTAEVLSGTQEVKQ